MKSIKEHNVPDELNPNFILNGVKTELLVKTVNGTIDLNELAKKELVNRGLDKNGKWIGFKNAEIAYNTMQYD